MGFHRHNHTITLHEGAIMAFDRAFLILGLIYAILGMLLGIVMAASHDHGQHVTHAHILLVGFVASVLYGLIHRVWMPGAGGVLALLQFLLHHLGALAMVIGLYLLYGGYVPGPSIEPVLSIASLAVFAGAVLMLVLALVHARSSHGY